VASTGGLEARWQLYRILGEPFRLRLLALAREEELAMGELAELLDESLPNVSRHVASLRQAGLLSERRHGTRSFVRLMAGAEADAVILDALAVGRSLCEEEGRLLRIADIVRARDVRSREFFAHSASKAAFEEFPAELPAFLSALRGIVPQRSLALDAGTGEGAWLDALAPLFERVVAVDRSEQQLARAERRVAERGYANVTLLRAELGDEALGRALGAGADLVVAARVLHHAPRPWAVLEALVRLLRPGGRLVVVDYQRHSDEAFRERQADVWNGFEADELEVHAQAAGLRDVRVTSLPSALLRGLGDGHLGWQALSGVRPLPARNA
jgi:SAM-dependent methyltransferase/DNA-binding MarR family transcriptional regulator